jgi:hypothetical protein
MRRYVLVGVLLALLMIGSNSVSARGCDKQSVARDFVKFLNVIEVFDTTAEKWTAIVTWFRARSSTCEPLSSTENPLVKLRLPVLSFSSRNYGTQPVLGPLTIPDGFYRVRVVTEGSFIADLEVIDGACRTTSGARMFFVSEGEASKGYELFLNARGCKAFISVSDITANWTLELYTTSISDAVGVANEYSSAELGMAPLIGPVRFPDGYYKATLVTTKYLIIQILTVSGECGDSSFHSLFSVSPGQANSGAEALIPSQGCVAYFTFYNTSEPWTLTFEPIE